jgi:hypothetical protein
MGRAATASRIRVKAIAINVAVFACLFFGFEATMHIVSPKENPWLKPPSAKSELGITHPAYGHGLAPNHKGEEDWGSNIEVATNSLGLRDRAPRNVPLRSNRTRVLFLGDSFTEGVGTQYEETFVGRFAAAFPQLDVLNAGVSSYAPSHYYAKAKYLLETGLQIDEIIVYVDVSDIQDEAIFYQFDRNGRLLEGSFDPTCHSQELIFWSPSPWVKWSYVLELAYSRYLLHFARHDPPQNPTSTLTGPGEPYGPDRARASWTYDSHSPCYGKMGIEGGISKTLAQMDKLFALASERNIPLSVGVYPWPQQLLYDSEESRQVQIWRAWCDGKCRRRLDGFPSY